MQEEKYLGALEDNRSREEQAKNYLFAETVGIANANSVQWFEKKQPKGLNFELNKTTWRRFPVQNQAQSGSCVAQTFVKLMGILSYLKYKIFIRFSAGHVYTRRSNKKIGDGQGMIADDVYKIGQKGVTFEELMPSQKLNESEMNALYETELHKKVGLATSGYIWLPIGDIETVASVIQTTKKGVMTWFRFHYKEWKDVPKVLSANPPNHHSVASVDFTLYNKEKSLVIDESWGEDTAMDGQRVISESFYKERNTHASYPIDLKFDPDSVTEVSTDKFTKRLYFIDLDPKTQQIMPDKIDVHKAQENDVIRLQDVLKKEGLFPTNIGSSGLYHELTRKAVKAFQLKYSVASLAELNEVDGKIVGDKTLAKLNEIISNY